MTTLVHTPTGHIGIDFSLPMNVNSGVVGPHTLLRSLLGATLSQDFSFGGTGSVGDGFEINALTMLKYREASGDTPTFLLSAADVIFDLNAKFGAGASNFQFSRIGIFIAIHRGSEADLTDKSLGDTFEIENSGVGTPDIVIAKNDIRLNPHGWVCWNSGYFQQTVGAVTSIMLNKTSATVNDNVIDIIIGGVTV